MTSKARILFVDDEKRVLNSMRGMFRRDFELFLTTEGASAVKIAAENSIDVIVADQRMPGMTGTEVLGKIKQLSPRTVRILLTGYADPSAVEGSINVGEVFRFLSKPCPPKLLRETLELAIEAARATPEPPSVSAAAPTATQPPQSRERDSASESLPTEKPAELQPMGSPANPPIRQSELTPPTPITAARPPVPAQPTAAQQKPEFDDSSSSWGSVTEVVMSGDSSQEVRQLDLESHSSSKMNIVKDVGVVFYTVDSQFAETAIRAVSADRNVVLATTLTKVSDALEQRQAGVLVTDFTTNSAVLQKMIGALKQHLPELVTIVISGSRDTTDMINLINFGQVFRFMLKPIEPETLRHDINAAAARHLYLRKNPDSAKRHQVASQSLASDGSETLSQFLARVRSLRDRRFDPTDTST